MQITDKLKLYDDVKALHSALGDILSRFVREYGAEEAGVAEAITVLARHPELPTPFSLAMRIPATREGIVLSVVDAVEETGLIDDRRD